MPEPLGPLIPVALPPILLSPARTGRARCADATPQLMRVAYALTALALPALGIVATDTVPRTGLPRVEQTAASAVTPGEAAVPRAVPTPRPIRVTLRDRAEAMYASRKARS